MPVFHEPASPNGGERREEEGGGAKRQRTWEARQPPGCISSGVFSACSKTAPTAPSSSDPGSDDEFDEHFWAQLVDAW